MLLSQQNHIYPVELQCLTRRRAISIRMVLLLVLHQRLTRVRAWSILLSLLLVIHPALSQARVRNHMGPLIATGPHLTQAKVQNHTSLCLTRAKVQKHMKARLQSHQMSPARLNIQLYQMLHQFLQILLISYVTVQLQHTPQHHFQRKFLANLIWQSRDEIHLDLTLWFGSYFPTISDSPSSSPYPSYLGGKSGKWSKSSSKSSKGSKSSKSGYSNKSGKGCATSSSKSSKSSEVSAHCSKAPSRLSALVSHSFSLCLVFFIEQQITQRIWSIGLRRIDLILHVSPLFWSWV